MNLAISVIEIAIMIVFPLVIVFNRAGQRTSVKVFSIAILYVLWYLTYSPFHELCHYAAARMLGLEVVDFRFLPRFWKGEVAGGFVRTVYENAFQEFLVVIAPYARDVLLVGLGYAMIRGKVFRGTVPVGIVLLLFVLSSWYNLVDNYFAYCRGNLNDFWAMRHYLGGTAVHLLAIAMVTSVVLGGLAAIRSTLEQVAGGVVAR